MLVVMTYTYFCVACLLYSQSISTIFSYEGFTASLNIFSLIISLLLLIPTSLMIRETSRPSSTFFLFMIYLIIVPTLTLYSFTAVSARLVGVTYLSLVIVLCFWALVPVKVINVSLASVSNITFFLVSVLIVFITLLVIFAGLGSFNIDLSRVYLQRKSLNDALPLFMFYLLPLITKVVLPTLVVLAMYKKQKILIVFCIVCSLFIFSFTGHKAVPIYIFTAILLYQFMIKAVYPIKLISVFLLGIMSLSIVDLALFSAGIFEPYSGWVGSVFGRRMLFVPSFLNGTYIDFFTDKQAYYWSASRITLGLVQQPYSMLPAELVGQQALGNANNYANAGWIGSGFAQAKVLGVIIYSAILGLIIKISDAYDRTMMPGLVISTSIIPIVVIITSSDLLTGLVTHGLVLLFLIYIFLSNKQGRNNIESRTRYLCTQKV